MIDSNKSGATLSTFFLVYNLRNYMVQIKLSNPIYFYHKNNERGLSVLVYKNFLKVVNFNETGIFRRASKSRRKSLSVNCFFLPYLRVDFVVSLFTSMLFSLLINVLKILHNHHFSCSLFISLIFYFQDN